MEFNWWAGLGLFFLALALDIVFALYTVAIVKLRPVFAANMSALTYVLTAAGVVSYVQNKFYLIPLCVGAFLGAYLVVKYESIKKSRAEASADTSGGEA